VETMADLIANLELAALPTTSQEERKRLLSFVVCGGGPTGVEFAAELVDMMAEEVLSYVSDSASPHLLV
jgi:NADH dehydrogenase FAD-containing subunit